MYIVFILSIITLSNGLIVALLLITPLWHLIWVIGEVTLRGNGQLWTSFVLTILADTSETANVKIV